MLHSLDFEKIKYYWDSGQWSLLYVHWAVLEGRITREEYKEITKEDFRVY